VQEWLFVVAVVALGMAPVAVIAFLLFGQ